MSGQIEIYAIQLYQATKLNGSGILLYDVSRKSGDPEFAPTWYMVKSYKDGSLSEEEYRLAYKKLMWESFTRDRSKWKAILSLDKVALGCYCPPGEFCHRIQLAEYLTSVGAHYFDISANNMGEL